MCSFDFLQKIYENVFLDFVSYFTLVYNCTPYFFLNIEVPLSESITGT